MFYFILFLLFFTIPSLSDGHSSDVERQTLLISLDGFRWDYVERIHHLLGDNCNIMQLIKSGAHAPQGITNTFSTVTFPNHYTLVTGLYQESHGIVSNNIWDPKENRMIDLRNDHDGSIYGGEPIWKTLKKHSHMHDRSSVVACLMWVGCQFGGFDEAHFVKYNQTMSWSDRIDRAIDWLSDESIKLVLMYYHEPDKTGHDHGPNSKEMDDLLKEIDAMIGELIKKLKEKKMYDEVNLIIASDHGMIDSIGSPILPVDAKNQSFYDVRSLEPAFWLVEPKPGHLNETIAYFKKYPHLKVIEKPNIPERWHYKNNPRIASLLILADLGYTLYLDLKGIHGYDNQEKVMRPTFMAHGPAFVPNSVIPMDMSTVDVYLLLCTILDVTPAPNNGSSVYFPSFLHQAYLLSTENFYHRMSTVSLAVSISVIIFALCMFLCHRQRRKAHQRRIGRILQENNGYLYKPLPLESVGPLLTTSIDHEIDSDEFDDGDIAIGNRKQ